MNEQEIIVVLGMHRSGTSVLARAIQSLGADLGVNLMPPVEGNNPRGFFEDLEIQAVSDKVLRRLGRRWNSVGPYPKEPQLSEDIADLSDAAVRIVEGKLASDRVFCFKNPRTAVLLPFWSQVFDRLGLTPRYVVSVRNPADVVESLRSRDGMSDSEGLFMWLTHYMNICRGTSPDTRMFVSFDSMIEGPGEVLDRLAAFVGRSKLALREKERNQFLQEFLDKDLRHHSHENPLDAGIPGPHVILSLYELLGSLASGELSDGNEEFRTRWKVIEREFRELDTAYELFGRQESRLLSLQGENDKLKVALFKYQVAANPDAVRPTITLSSETEVAAHVDLLQETINQLTDRTAADSRRIFDKLSDLERTHAQLKSLESEVTQKSAEVDALSSKLAELKGQADSRQNAHAAERRSLESRITALTSEVAKKDSEMAVLINSRSFRLTRPLRVTRSYLVRLRAERARSLASGAARLTWRILPLPADAKTRLKHHLFFRTGRTFAWTKAYRDWVAHEAFHGRIALATSDPGEKSTSVLPHRRLGSEARDAGWSSETGGCTASIKPQLWSGHSSVLEQFCNAGPVPYDELPLEIVQHASAITQKSSLTVSVIIPTWNRQTTIQRAIDSALDQSYPPLEIIVSDDGSTDETLKIVRSRYADAIAAERVVIVENEHGGVSAARNAAMRIAKGDLFAYLDSDNRWRHHFLNTMVAAFEDNDEIVTAYAGLVSFDLDNGSKRIRSRDYDRRQLLDWNFIDLNIFMHRRIAFDIYGGFDESLSRLVDWELIIRYTKHYCPLFLPFIGLDYYLSEKTLANITHTVALDENRQKILNKHFQERVQLGLETLRIAYFIYDFPAMSQTFVLNELRWLVSHGYDVKVYYAISPEPSAELDFDIDSHCVSNADDLARLFREHGRNICHSHFAYPGATLFVRPACESTGVRFTLMPHAVDIFHHKNRARNRIGEVVADPNCLKVFVFGDHHRRFLLDRGVPREKVAYAFQAVDVVDFAAVEAAACDSRFASPRPLHGIVIARFIQKKGIEFLLEALSRLDHQKFRVTLYGYGPLEDAYRQSIRELRLENVSFGGVLVGKEQVLQAYAEADFLVAPCVEADDGDMDGFPTVILEAMAAGIPVVTTSISAIPDYIRDGIEAILAEPGNVESLVDALERLASMTQPRRIAMLGHAKRFLAERIGTERTIQRLLDVWEGYRIEILLVTYNVSGYDDREATYEIIRRILSRTTTPFTLTIVDNASDADFWNKIVSLCRGKEDMRLLRKGRNVLCGPATNVALRLGTEEYLVYVCSKEGFVRAHGWERPLLDFMRKHPEVPIAGDLSYLPRHTLGKELALHPEFSKFRGGEFACANPGRPFGHVQGGIYIADRARLVSVGGFNSALPQSNMDVEMSYWLEVNGYPLGRIASVASKTVKTLPPLRATLSESVQIAHPLTLHTVAGFDRIGLAGAEACNVCGAVTGDEATDGPGRLFDGDGVAACCGSTPFGRSLFRTLAADRRIHRGGKMAMLSADQSVADALRPGMFSTVLRSDRGADLIRVLEGSEEAFSCIAIDERYVGEADRAEFWRTVASSIQDDGLLLIASASWEKAGDSPGEVQLIDFELDREGISCDRVVVDEPSSTLMLDWRPLVRFDVSRTAG